MDLIKELLQLKESRKPEGDSDIAVEHESGNAAISIDFSDPEEREGHLWVKADNEAEGRQKMEEFDGWFREMFSKHFGHSDLSLKDGTPNDEGMEDGGYYVHLEFPPADFENEDDQMNEAANNELKTFWDHICNGIYASSVIGWDVQKLEGTMQSYTATLSAESWQNDPVVAVIKFDSKKPDVIHMNIKLDGKEIIDGEYGAGHKNLTNEADEITDMITHAVDDRFEQDDLEDPFGGDDY